MTIITASISASTFPMPYIHCRMNYKLSRWASLFHRWRHCPHSTRSTLPPRYIAVCAYQKLTQNLSHHCSTSEPTSNHILSVYRRFSLASLPGFYNHFPFFPGARSCASWRTPFYAAHAAFTQWIVPERYFLQAGKKGKSMRRRVSRVLSWNTIGWAEVEVDTVQPYSQSASFVVWRF